jgi:hypothetical protein
MAFHRGNAAIARVHADEVERYASQSGMSYLIVAARLCQALVKSADQNFKSASSDLYEALNIARQSRTGLEIEARLLAYLAEILDYAGSQERALTVAAEAIEVARRRSDRVAELHAHIVAAHLMLDGDANAAQQAEQHLQRAEALLEETAAGLFAPRLLDLRGARPKVAYPGC